MSNVVNALTFLMAGALVTCSEAPPEPRGTVAYTDAAPAHPSVILVALDGVRWQDVLEGVDEALAEKQGVPAAERVGAPELLPELHRLMTEDGAAIGASGPPMEASGPNYVSVPGYMEMLTGRRDPGCTHNHCERVAFPTVVDEVGARGGDGAVVASWAGLGIAIARSPALSSSTVGRTARFGTARFETEPVLRSLLSAGEAAAPHPGHGDFRPDAHTAAIALAYFEAREPDFLFVGLGEPDEYGHRNDYRGYLRSLRHADAAIGRLGRAVARRNARGAPTTLLVTTDHGRSTSFTSHGAEHPESRRVWLVAAGAGIEARGRVVSPEPRYLADVAPTVRTLLGEPVVAGTGLGEPLSELF